MKHLLRLTVKDTFGNENLPPSNSRRFYPNTATIRSHIVKIRKKLRHSMIDQECLLIKCEEWKKCDPSVKVFLRPNCSGEDGGCRVLICDFHREQAWHCWIVKKTNNCSEFKDPIISMLQNIAWAQNKKMADAAIVKLKCSNFWLDNKFQKFKKYITNYWLQIKEKWIWYRQDRWYGILRIDF
ncbi:uncharacterized protein LOC105847005 isoform X2 [Hydra vulgaris]